jgi:predicted  nucleic acid-binding Zn-ribbon protein
MAQEIGNDQTKTMSDRVKQLEARLLAVMKERGAIETEIEEARKHAQVLHKRASEIYAAEGTLRKQIDDARSMRDSATG